METVKPGMKEVLEELMKMETRPEEDYATKKDASLAETWVTESKEKLYRALQELTEGTPNGTVEAVKGEWVHGMVGIECLLGAHPQGAARKLAG